MHFERANRQQALIALVQILGLAVWFSASAVVPTLQREWGISPAAGVWLTASVQVGFVAGAVTSTVGGAWAMIARSVAYGDARLSSDSWYDTDHT